MSQEKNNGVSSIDFDGRDGGREDYQRGPYDYSGGSSIQSIHDLRKAAMASCRDNFEDEVPCFIPATVALNNWLNRITFTRQSTSILQTCANGYRVWSVRQSVQATTSEGPIKFKGSAVDSSKKRAVEEASQNLLDQVMCPQTQGPEDIPKESVQGISEQASEKQHNTIVTRDQGETASATQEANSAILESIASSEPITEIADLVGRWMPMNKITINTGDRMGTVKATYYMPKSILTDQVTCSPAIIPFETFVYGKYDMAMKFIVNANAFHCGKVIVSVKFDSYQADDVNKGYQAALSRKHIILDLNSNNEATIDLPFRYHRAFIRNQAHTTSSVGVRPGKYCTVQVMVLSPLKTGNGGSTSVDLRPMYLFRKAKFAGMSYRVPNIQGMDDLIRDALPLPAIKELIIGAEKAIDQLGKSHNQDKPTDHRASIFIPRPRLHFASGKGISDASSLRMTPNALTSFDKVHAYHDEPKTTLDIAKIWGVRNTIAWSMNQKEGEELFNSIIDPTMRSYSENYSGEPTPVEYVSSFYNFWSGTLELRLDFVSSNMGHTGAVSISAEFNRESGVTNECESHSCYTKIFHLGEQKSCSFVIPYIYDTVMRRSCGLAYNPLVHGQATSDDIRMSSTNVRPESRMRVKVRVLNALRPVSTVASSIDILVFFRGGKNFHLHGLKQSDMYLTRNVVAIDSFPNDNYKPATPAPSSAPVNEKKRKPRDVSILTPQDVADGKATLPEDRYVPGGGVWNEIPTVQMDTGDKENEDTTDNFRSGLSANTFISTDSQVGIKDILRRPVLMFNHVTVKPSSTGYFIPMMPPSRMMNHQTNLPTQFSNMLGQTPQAMLMNLFRFWRGSMRYTIICHTSTDHPIFLTHIPHTGTRMYANKSVGGLSDYLQTPIYGCGLSTDMIIPQVNKTGVFEVPYDSENNWTLTFDEDAARNYAWRDKGDTCAGHLVISCEQECVVSVFWSAGDDFEVANFYGIPAVENQSFNYAFDDKHARVQMDAGDDYYDALEEVPGVHLWQNEGRIEKKPVENFLRKNVSTVVDSFKRVMTPDRCLKTAIMAVPYVGTAYGTGVVVDTVVSVGDKTVKSIDKAVDKLDILKDKLESKLSGSIDVLMQAIQDAVSRVLEGFKSTATVINYCYDMILDIFIAWIDKSWTAIGVGMVRFIGKLVGMTCISALLGYAEQIGTFVREHLVLQEPTVQIPSCRQVTIVGILAGLIGTMFRVKIKGWKYESFMSGMLSEITDSRGVSYLFTVLKFVESTFSVVKDMIMEALGYVSPEASALKLLSAQSESIAEFVKEAQLVTSEANGVLVQDPRFRLRFWKTVMQAYQFQRLLTSITSPNVAPQIGRLCQEVIKVGNEKFLDISASPVRYEPFVITIEGPTAVGKSEMASTIVRELLKAINFSRPSSENIYYRMPGAKFWSGYRDQPAVCYDDWLAMTNPEASATTLTELFQLKSTAIFIPEMAHLDEKKIRANPLILLLLTNDAYPDNIVNNNAQTPSAIYRRREIVIKATRKKEYVGVDLRNMSEEDQINFNHVEFMQYRDVSDKRSITTKKVDFNTMKNWMVKKFQKYHQIETQKIKRRLEDVGMAFTAAQPDEISIADPFDLYYKVNNRLAELNPDFGRNGFLPSEVLEKEVLDIIQGIRQNNANNPAPEPIGAIADPWGEEDARAVVERVRKYVPRNLKLAREAAASAAAAPVAETQAPMDYVRQLYDLALERPMAFFIGVATSTRGIGFISHWTTEMCNTFIEKLLRSSVSAPTPCSICYEPGVKVIICGASVETDQPHYVCLNCYNAAVDARHEFNSCPMCRSEDMTMVTAAANAALVGIYARSTISALFGVKVTVKVINFFIGTGVDSIYSTFTRWMLWGSIARYLSRDTNTALSAGALVPTACDFLYRIGRCLLYPFVGTQANDGFESDDEEEGASTSSGRSGPMHMFAVTVNERVIKKICEDKSHYDNAPCLHETLWDFAESCKYREGRYMFNDFLGANYAVSEYPCCETCSFKDPLTYTNFLKQHIMVNGNTFSASIRNHFNLRNDVEYYRSLIPTPLLPDWMLPDDMIVAELNQLREGSWWKFLSEYYNNYRTIILTLGAVTAAITGLFAIKAFFSTPDQQVLQQAGLDGVSGDQHTRFVRSSQRSLRQKGRRVHFQGAEHTPLLDDVVKQQVSGNYVSIQVETEKGVQILTACGFANRTALLPRHYVDLMMKYPQVIIHRALQPHTKLNYTFNYSDFVLSPISDIATWSLPASFGFFKDIRKFIALDADLDDYLPVGGSILLAPNRKNPILKDQRIEFNGIQNSQIIRNNDNTKFEVYDVLTYNYSQSGACGSIVLMERSQRPIIGMHFAGIGTLTAGEGFAVLLTKESLGSFGEIASLQMEDVDLLSMEEAHIIMSENCNVDYLGALPKDKTPHSPQKTKLRKSLIFEANGLESYTEPAILHKSDPRYTWEETPLRAGVEKHGHLTEDFSTKELDIVETALWDGWISKMKPAVAEPARLTVSEAICGFQIEYYDKMVLSKSAGFPYILSAKKSKEDYIFVTVDEQDRPVSATISEDLEHTLVEKRKLRKEGIIPFTPFVDSLKDERKKKEKIKKLGSTRVFCNPPVDYVISMRQDFMHFTAAYMKDRFNQQHAVGINPLGTEWTQLVMRLVNISPHNVCTLDYANFGPGFNSGVAERCMNLMVKWTLTHVRGVSENELRCHLYECLYSTHVVNNTVYRQRAGSPSGAPITVIINSLVNQFLIMLSWLYLVKIHLPKEERVNMWQVYKENVCLFVYGDDLIMSVSDKYIGIFNTLTISNYFRTKKIVATDATKSEDIVPYTDIFSASFLKRGFVMHPTRKAFWLSPIEWISVNECVQWVWENRNYKIATRENAVAGIMMAHGHGIHKFNDFKEQVNQALIKAGIEPILLTWEAVDDLYFTE